MTIKMLMEQLKDYPEDYQVCDTAGDIIMYSVLKEGKVFLENKSQMDMDEELDSFVKEAIENNYDDRDAVQMLKDMGYTLDDLMHYRRDTYKWAIQYW